MKKTLHRTFTDARGVRSLYEEKRGGQATFWGTGDFRKRTLTVPGELLFVCTGFWEYVRGFRSGVVGT